MTKPLAPGRPLVTPHLIVMRCTFIRPPLTKNKARRMRPIVQYRAEKPIKVEAILTGRIAMRYAAVAGWAIPFHGQVTIRLVRTVTNSLRTDASSGQPTLEAWIDGLTVGTVKHPGCGLLGDDRHEIVRWAHCEIELGDTPGCRVEITRA